MAINAARTDAPVHMRVPFSASAVPAVRAHLMRWMDENGGSSERIDDARVILSELVANAIRHAKPLPDGQILVSWCAEGHELELSVSDGGGPTLPRAVSVAPSALAGRGLAIIETLSLSWWAEQTPSKSTVYARIAMA